MVALADRADGCHAMAKAFLHSIPSGVRFHTSNYILDETITRLRLTVGVDVAIRAAEALWASELYQIHMVDHALEREALRLMRKYADQRLSFTDCTTIALLKQLEMDQVFAFDEDFSKVGYRVLPETLR